MGGHTLGRAHKEASGFSGPWVEQQDHLDNAFFIDLRDARLNWRQSKAVHQGEDLWSWVW